MISFTIHVGYIISIICALLQSVLISVTLVTIAALTSEQPPVFISSVIKKTQHMLHMESV
jgi:hypothetical protein